VNRLHGWSFFSFVANGLDFSLFGLAKGGQCDAPRNKNMASARHLPFRPDDA
jgi:hypothetical protein